MPDDSLFQLVRQFLAEFRSVATSPGKIHLVYRKDGKNQATMSNLELTKAALHEELLGLEPENYSSHDVDRDRPETAMLWIFGKWIKGREIYIKIKIPSRQKVVCISFHEAEFFMKYPLQHNQ